MAEYNIPSYTLAALERYRDEGCPTGGFLYACLTNNMMQAIGRADENNQLAIAEIARWIYNELPANSHGSPEEVNTWLDKYAAKRAAKEVKRQEHVDATKHSNLKSL